MQIARETVVLDVRKSLWRNPSDHTSGWLSKNCAGSPMKIWGRNYSTCLRLNCRQQAIGFLSPKKHSRICATLAVWSNDPNNYGPDWTRIRDRVRARDKYQCQVCGAATFDYTRTRQHDVHHKIPFRIHSLQSKMPIDWKISPHFAEPAIKKWSKTSASAVDLRVSVLCLATSRRSS